MKRRGLASALQQQRRLRFGYVLSLRSREKEKLRVESPEQIPVETDGHRHDIEINQVALKHTRGNHNVCGKV